MKKLLTVVSLILAGSASFAAAPVFNAADTVWVTLSSMLVFLMVPGLAFFYAGLVRKKNVLGTMMHSLIALAVIGIEWILIGYSMAFGPTVHGLVGNLQYLLLNGIDMNAIFPGYGIPVYVFLMFQGMFAVITPALISGAVADRIKFSSYVLFILAWGLIVYNPLAHRLSTIAKMDRIVVVDGGKIIEQGSHSELLQNENSLYKKLWTLQAGGFLDDEDKEEPVSDDSLDEEKESASAESFGEAREE
jgi:hypothetical protein